MKFKEAIKIAGVSLAMIGIFATALLLVSNFTLRAATNGGIYLPPEVEYINIPDSPVLYTPENSPFNVTVIDITTLDANQTIDPLALPIDSAVAIAAQYIYDIFGVCISGMYVEIGYTNPPWLSRSHWAGQVSSINRRPLERMAEVDTIRDTVRTRIEAGEDPDEVWESLTPKLWENYVHADFSFAIDSITGERLDIWRSTPRHTRYVPSADVEAIAGYVQYRWANNAAPIPPIEIAAQEVALLYEVARRMAPKQFINTAVVSVEFAGVNGDIYVDNYGNVTVRPPQYNAFFVSGYLYVDNNGNVATAAGPASFVITDETERVATMVICQKSLEVISISSSRNDTIIRNITVMDDGRRIYGLEGTEVEIMVADLDRTHPPASRVYSTPGH